MKRKRSDNNEPIAKDHVEPPDDGDCDRRDCFNTKDKVKMVRYPQGESRLWQRIKIATLNGRSSQSKYMNEVIKPNNCKAVMCVHHFEQVNSPDEAGIYRGELTLTAAPEPIACFSDNIVVNKRKARKAEEPVQDNNPPAIEPAPVPVLPVELPKPMIQPVSPVKAPPLCMYDHPITYEILTETFPKSRTLKYIGLETAQLLALVELLSVNDYLNRTISTHGNCSYVALDALVIFLVWLRLGVPYVVLETIFKKQETTLREIVRRVMTMLYTYFKLTNEDKLSEKIPLSEQVCSKELLEQYPDGYWGSFDCSEFQTTQSSYPKYNAVLYSHYKEYNSHKYLIIIGSDGKTKYCSKGYPGSFSDADIFHLEGLFKKMSRDSRYLADRGFYYLRLLGESTTIEIVTPPMSAGKDIPFTSEQLLYTRMVARDRIHIERLNRRIKMYRKTCDIYLSLEERDMVVYIAAFLSNLRCPLTFATDDEDNGDLDDDDKNTNNN